MIALLLAAQIFVVQAPPPPSKEEAARILREAPGISNRTNVYVASAEEQRRLVFVPTPTAPAVPAPSAESDRARAIRMGIPGSFTPREWAILHSGARK